MAKEINFWDEARLYFGRSNCLKRRYAAVIVNQDGLAVGVGVNKAVAVRIDSGIASPGLAVGAGVNKAAEPCKTCAREGVESNTGDYATCSSVHAEQFAMLQAGKLQLYGATLYLVCDKDTDPTPCPICQRMLDVCGVTLKREPPKKGTL